MLQHDYEPYQLSAEWQLYLAVGSRGLTLLAGARIGHPARLQKARPEVQTRLGFESFFEAKVNLTNPVSSNEKGLVVVVSCLLQGPNNVRCNAVVFHSEAGLLK